MNQEEITKEAAKIIRQHLPADYEIFLFGSWAKEQALPASDLDIGILGANEVPWETMMKIKSAASGLPTLRQIDIVDLRAAGEEFRKNVLKYGVKL